MHILLNWQIEFTYVMIGRLRSCRRIVIIIIKYFSQYDVSIHEQWNMSRRIATGEVGTARDGPPQKNATASEPFGVDQSQQVRNYRWTSMYSETVYNFRIEDGSINRHTPTSNGRSKGGTSRSPGPDCIHCISPAEKFNSQFALLLILFTVLSSRGFRPAQENSKKRVSKFWLKSQPHREIKKDKVFLHKCELVMSFDGRHQERWKQIKYFFTKEISDINDHLQRKYESDWIESWFCHPFPEVESLINNLSQGMQLREDRD